MLSVQVFICFTIMYNMFLHLISDVQVSAVSSVDVKYGQPLSGAVGGDPTDWRYYLLKGYRYSGMAGL